MEHEHETKPKEAPIEDQKPGKGPRPMRYCADCGDPIPSNKRGPVKRCPACQRQDRNRRALAWYHRNKTPKESGA